MKPLGYLGLDVGGTGAKAGVYDAAGRRLGAGHARYAPTVSDAGHVEIPIEAIYEAARVAACQAIQRSGVAIAALAIAAQGQTFAPLDGEGRSLHPAILWYDSRAADDAARLSKALAGTRLGKRAPSIPPIATAAKIVWLRRHYPEQMARARHYLLLPDYLAFRLTGEPATDPCTAGSTGLYLAEEGRYCPEALAATGVEERQLAPVFPSGARLRQVAAAAAAEWGLSPETLLVSGTNDQYAGALGAGNCRPGILSETTGTCLALVTLSERLPAPLPPGVLSGRFPIEGYHFALAYAKTAGLVLDWVNRVLCPGLGLAELDTLAAAVPVGSRGVAMLPHFDGMVSPTPNAAARGVFAGLSLSHGVGDLYRATLEAIAYCLRENLELLERIGLPVDTVRSIGGGARSDLWLQIKADVTGRQIERPMVTEAATLGAAMLAAVGHGCYRSVAQCSAAGYWVDRVFSPEPEARARYEAAYQRYRGLYQSLYGSAP